MGSIDEYLIKILQDLKECTSLEEVNSLKEKVRSKCKRRKIDEGSRKYCDVEDKEVHTSEESKMLNLEQVVKSLKDLKVQAKELLDRGAFPYGVTIDDPDRLNNVELVIPPNIVGEVFHSNVEKLRECLMQNEVSRIGICGMGGVGKTTLLQCLYNKVLEKRNTFGYVYWVTVSNDCSIYNLQNKIANEIAKGLLRDVHDEARRAALLAQELKKKGKFVLFLDDMWDNFVLYKVGIPENVECKLVLTARSKDVCRRMGCDDNNIIQVDPLSKENAWNLFVKYYSNHDIQPPIEEIAKQVVRECGGLPLGIITLASSLRGTDDICEWKNILSKLQSSETASSAMKKDVFPILRFSYDRLDDSQLQECLLYCATYPEDYEIPRDKLIWGFIDKGLIKYEKEHTMEQMMDEGHTILNKLERACLLISIEGERMKMHDLIRAMALQVSGSKFMVKAGIGLTDFPSDEKAWTEDIEVVSLMHNVLSEISYTPNCQKLSVMLLQYNFRLWRIPNDFFERIHELTVVDLSHTRIKVLPKSISYLIRLTALILRGCLSLEDVPSLENLTAIRRLDLSWSKITKIPSGLEKLLNLKYLNLKDCYIEQFPIEFLVKLSRLQYLNLKGCKYYASAKELIRLKNLEFFDGCISQIYDFNAYVKLMKRYQRLKKYSIVVGGSTLSSLQCDRNVTLIDCEISNYHMEFPKDIQSLKFEYCVLETLSGLLLLPVIDTLRNLYRGTGTSWTPPIYSQSSFSNLRKIEVCDCPEIKYLFTTKEIRYLPNLEKIGVVECPKLENIIMDVYEVEEDACTNTRSLSFSNLKIIQVFDCPKLKYLFTTKDIWYISNIEMISVWKCPKLENVIMVEEDASTNICSLSKLNYLHLRHLPKLESICSEKRVSMSCVSLKTITILYCPKLKRMSLSLPINLSPTSFLEVDVDDMQMWESLEWDHPDAKSLLQTSVRLYLRNP